MSLDGDLLSRPCAAEKTALFGHPLGAQEMTLVCIARTVRLAIRIDMQDYSCDFPPVGSLVISLQEPQVRHNVLLIIRCQRWLCRSQVSQRRIELRGLHDRTVAESLV
ncbi:hypothetical protein TSA1_08745 [Bradyrhizobium nitroreducens]|uniref:Uncharacterized protein n=1 Tax=Bradyrhizobium nitroreducens TaxID=709803 RepID=A0A2M6U8D1_9BRAD|nr:hypothetical protein TSA1_08745 [Bradyrhizobium nitroreducens]